MNKHLKWLAPLFATVILISCGKEEDPPETKTKTQLLTQSSWKFQSATASGTDITNNSAILCIKDDVITFSSNGTGTIVEGANICTPTTAGNFTWSFQSGETVVVMSSGLFPGGSGTFTVNSLTETTLTISQNVTITGFPAPVPVTAVYVH
jgi:hypothetical protein